MASKGGIAHSAALIESSFALVSSLEGRARTLNQSPTIAFHLLKATRVVRNIHISGLANHFWGEQCKKDTSAMSAPSKGSISSECGVHVYRPDQLTPGHARHFLQLARQDFVHRTRECLAVATVVVSTARCVVGDRASMHCSKRDGNDHRTQRRRLLVRVYT